MADKIKSINHYLRVWFMMSKNSFTVVVNQKVAFWFFLTGKIIRFLFYTAFIIFLLKGANTLAGYSLNETIIFFLCFNLVDVLSQFLFRESYRFRPKIISGDFDFTLLKPINSLFTVLMGGADLLDLITVPFFIILLWLIGYNFHPDLGQIVIFILLIFNSVVISAAFHILVLSFGILTFEVDNAIMMYRDLTSMGRFPVDIYKEPLRGFLTFLLPVGIMMTFPGKALVGLLDPTLLLIAIAVGLLFFLIAIHFWNFAIKKYTSASS